MTALPHAPEAERLLLCCALLLWPKTVAFLPSTLEAESFCLSQNRIIWGAIWEQWQAQQPMDWLAIGARLKKSGSGQPIADYLHGLTKERASLDQVPWAVAEILRTAALRRQAQAGAQIATQAMVEGADPLEVAANGEASMRQALGQMQPEFVTARQALNKVLKNLEARYTARRQGLSLDVIPTGFEWLDQQILGLRRGGLVVLAGQKKGGKSALALQLMTSCGVPALSFGLEMPDEEQMERIVSRVTGIDGMKLLSGDLGDSDWARLTRTIIGIPDQPWTFEPGADKTADQIRQIARRWHHSIGSPRMSIVLVDYLQLVKPHGRRHDNREREVAETSRQLKLIADDTGATVLALSQLNDKGNARESTAIEADAHQMLVVEPTADSRVVDLLVKYSRGTPMGEVAGCKVGVRLDYDRATHCFTQHGDGRVPSEQPVQPQRKTYGRSPRPYEPKGGE